MNRMRCFCFSYDFWHNPDVWIGQTVTCQPKPISIGSWIRIEWNKSFKYFFIRNFVILFILIKAMFNVHWLRWFITCNAFHICFFASHFPRELSFSSRFMSKFYWITINCSFNIHQSFYFSIICLVSTCDYVRYISYCSEVGRCSPSFASFYFNVSLYYNSIFNLIYKIISFRETKKSIVGDNCECIKMLFFSCYFFLHILGTHIAY